MSGASYSIICPTFEGEKKLPALIECLEANIKTVEAFPEIIFVVDASSDSSIAVLTHFQESHPNMKMTIHENSVNLGPAQSRNVGVQIASGEIILFLDDDCRPSPTWYLDLDSAWKSVSAKTMGIGSVIIPSELNSFNGRYSSVFSPIKPWPLMPREVSLVRRIKNYYWTPNPKIHGAAYLSGASMSFRNEAFTKVGGFSPSLRISEDIEICEKMRKLYGDNCLEVVDTYTMFHDFSDKFSSTLKRSYRYGLGSGKNFWRGVGSLSFNPGPLLIFTVFVALLASSAISGEFTESLTPIASLSLLLVVFSYSLFVTWGKAPQRLPLIERPKFGLAFLLSELANTLGFFSASLIAIKSRRKPQ